MTIYEQLAQEEHLKLDLQRQISGMDYLSLKHADGCDMSEYNDPVAHPEYHGDWLSWKQSLRARINICDKRIAELRKAIEAEEAAEAEKKPMEE